MVSQYVDCLERDYLSAYPDEHPIFKDGMEKETERLITLMVLKI